MATDQIKMNGAAFNRSFVQSLSLTEFIDNCVDVGIYRQYRDQVLMLKEVWHICNPGVTFVAPEVQYETKVIKTKPKKRR